MRGQTWRTEPEIDEQRQKDLVKRRTLRTNSEQNLAPFKDETLSRADVEWLLANHESEGVYGPVNLEDDRHGERTSIEISGANLVGVNLSHLPLTRIVGSLSTQGEVSEQHTLFTINLEKTNLAGAHLEEAYLAGARMSNANLTGGSLREALLNEAHLEKSVLNEADLEYADLTGSHLSGASLIEACLERANLREAHVEKVNFNRAHLEGVDLRGGYITGAKFTKAHLELADLRKVQGSQAGTSFKAAYLEGADFGEAHLEGADFSEAHLERADFSEAYLAGADFTGAYLGGVSFKGTHLEGADFRGAQLQGKQLQATDLERIRNCSSSNSFPQVLPPADLREAFFSSATRLKDAILGDSSNGFISIADVSWGDVNLNVIDWDKVHWTGDEQRARTHVKRGRDREEKRVLMEEYCTAVRANRQLAVILQNQGLNEVAARFSYNAQRLQRRVLRQQRKWWLYLLWVLFDLLVGYGYKPLRSFLVYLVVIAAFTVIYHLLAVKLTWQDAFVFSVVALGRGLLPDTTVASDPVAFASVFEALISLIIEATFIAALTQRFFGK